MIPVMHKCKNKGYRIERFNAMNILYIYICVCKHNQKHVMLHTQNYVIKIIKLLHKDHKQKTKFNWQKPIWIPMIWYQKKAKNNRKI